MADVSLQTTPRVRSGRRNLRLWLPLAWITTLGLAALFAPLIAPHDPLYQDLFLERLPPFFMSGTEPGYWLGTDSLGRDVLSRVIYGTRIALCVSLIAATATCLVGSTLGLLAGYFGGWWDRVISRLIEIWMAFPPVLFAVLLVAVMGTGLTSVIVAIALIDWTRFARVIRAETMVQAQMDYVDSAQIGGARRLTTLVSEILPNVLPSIVALLMLEMGIAVIVEGAGSPAEINLREGDIANMGFAEAVDCDVILIADIDRGGVFAHLVGTLALLSASEQARVKGFVINRFRGDISLLEPGLDWLEQHTGKPVIGVLPYLHGLQLDAEDAIDAWQPPITASAIRVVVPVLPRISNHTDFDSLRLNPAVELIYVGIDEPVPNADVIILPGSKSVRNDLQHLLDRGWLKAINKHLRYGGKLLGICGGFQMLGDIVHDPEGIEGAPGSSKAMSLLNMQTTLKPAKQLEQVSGCLLYGSQAAVEGYEIHCGISEGAALSKPFLVFDDARVDGAISADEQIIGTYVHGLFDKAEACSALLNWMGIEDAQTVDIDHIRHRELERLADTIEKHLELSLLGPDFAQPARPASHG